MFRKARAEDIARISEIYGDILSEEEAGRASIGWVRGVYPTRRTAEDGVRSGHMFVEEDGGRIVAAAKLNQLQEPAYALARWRWDAPADQVMVLHTLVVSPEAGGAGYGTRFVDFYEQYALAHGCRYLRMDTNEKNVRARALYKRLGYAEAGVVPTVFNGIRDVRLVCLEKKV
ncbi:MAG: GNAT family N-acetyltransferase [Oscillospiraceae bacterium]|nr:GNAT family N-acetyltransferase [Oscillospiraceae bacterium]